MYPSDYLYATSGGTTTNRATCLNTSGGLWGNSNVSDCRNNDWFFEERMTWTISPCTDTTFAYRIFTLYESGNVENGRSYYKALVKPVVFLKSSISITGGTGTQADPYTLG